MHFPILISTSTNIVIYFFVSLYIDSSENTTDVYDDSDQDKLYVPSKNFNDSHLKKKGYIYKCYYY